MDPVTVGGMFLSAFLQVLFDRIASGDVLNFFRARKFDEGLLRRLKISLLAVNKLLDDAEEKQITNKRVKQWFEELQDAVYDAEDLLDAINTEAMQEKMETDSKPKSAKSKLKLKIRNVFKHSVKSDSEIEIKLKEILERLEDIVKQRDILGLKEGFGVSEKLSHKLPTTSLVEEAVVYGRDDDKEAMLKLLLADNTANDVLGVITIKGMGGIGKTTLAQLVYNDSRIDQHFNFKAWVCISEEFDVFKVTRTILEAVTSSTSVTTNPDLLQVELKKNLMDKRFLLVLDDVWNENRNHWEMLKKPLQYGTKGSKILVTTRNEGVATIMRTVPTYYLKQLSDEDSWSLFAKYAFENGDSHVHPSFTKIGKEIIKKCEGLPLAAKALGGLLRYRTTPEQWVKVMESNVWDLRDTESSILPVLRVSYHYLPSHLKRCFTFSSIFPKDYEFEKEQLILLWTAQSLILHPERGGKIEELGDEFFNELVSRSFFERSSSNKSLFVMHDLINDLAKFVSGHSSLCMDRESKQEISERTRHLSYFRMRLKQFETVPKPNRLRTLLQLQRGERSMEIRSVYLYHEEVPDNLLQAFKLLRVLSLFEYEIYELPESISSLKHLRYLDLSKTSIKKLPDSICSLFNLQTLLLSHCSHLTGLPTKMWKLVNLLYLDISECYALREMPENIGRLKCLQKLSTFIVGANGGVSIRELGQISDLRGSLSILKLQNVASPSDALEARLKDKQHLHKLKLRWTADVDGSSQEYDVLEKLQPHENLKELTILTYGETRFPKWIGDKKYSNLVSLKLENCKHCQSLPSLGQLPSLKDLSVIKLTGLQKLDSEFYGNTLATKPFGSLESLIFENMSDWQEWVPCDVEAFPLLKKLGIYGCPKLAGHLPGHLPSLMNLSIGECPDLASSFPRAPVLSHLRLECSSEMLLNELPQELQSLSLHRYETLKSLPQGVKIINTSLKTLDLFRCPSLMSLPQAGLPSTLKSLRIYGCDELVLPMDEHYASLEYLTIEYSCDALCSLPLKLFPKLKNIEIRGCKNLESFSLSDACPQGLVSLTRMDVCNCPKLVSFPDGGLPFPNLHDFSFQNNETVKELPKQMLSLSSLSSVIIHNCPEIESLPAGGLPSCLTLLWISYSDKIAAELLAWGLHGLTSLRNLQISCECKGVKSFPEVGLLPETLTILKVSGFSDLETLEYEGLQHLTSLSELSIWGCPKLQSLPEEGLPTSLIDLSIGICPLLEPRLQREQGEDWDKIARIPRILIDGKVVLS